MVCLAEYIGEDRRGAREKINRKCLTWLEGLAVSGDPVACSMLAPVYREGVAWKRLPGRVMNGAKRR